MLIKRIDGEARTTTKNAGGEIANRERLLQAIGPVAEEEEATEPEEIATRRREIKDDIAFYRSQAAQAELALARADELETALSGVTRAALRERLLTRHPFPLAPATVAKAVPEAVSFALEIARSPVEWYATLSPEEHETTLLRTAGGIVSLLVLWVVGRLLRRRYGRHAALERPSYTRRFFAAMVEAVARGFVPASFFATVYFLVTSGATFASGYWYDVLTNLSLVLFFYVLAVALTRAVLAPDLPAWRLTPMAPDAARVLSRRIVYLATVYAIDGFLEGTIPEHVVSAELWSFYSLSIDVLEAVGLLLILQANLWRPEPEASIPVADGASAAAPPQAAGMEGESATAAEPRGGAFWTVVRRAIAAAAVFGIVAIAVGYINLGDWLIDNLLLTALVFGALFLVRGLMREFIGLGLGSSLVRRRIGLGDKGRQSLKFWLRGALDPVLVVAGFYVIATRWGLPREDLARFVGEALEGFTVGGVTISLIDIAAAIVVFVVVVVVTRLVRQTVSERVLARTRLDSGIRNSVAAGIGYVGVILAAVMAIGVMGFDFSNIAIIAGALSVGIGFGLQNVVNNFVSGLILLVERPVKVGDWIVIGEHQGFVKRISVRSTEIQTFDRASVILPNADLLNTAVMNWTHKDRLGRVQVPVGVAYGSDTEKVRDILLACAKAHPDVMSWPVPYVVFMDFGSSSLDFQLRAFLRNVENRLTVASDLRFAVDKAFREAGVEIPFPQRDLHLKGMDRLEQALAALAPAGKAGPGGGSVVPLRGPAPGARDDTTDPDAPAKDKPTGGGGRL